MNLIDEYIRVRGNSEAREILEDYTEYLRKRGYSRTSIIVHRR